MAGPVQTRVFKVAQQAIDENGLSGLFRLLRKASAAQGDDTFEKLGAVVRPGKKSSFLWNVTSATRLWLHKHLGDKWGIGRLFKLSPADEQALKKGLGKAEQKTAEVVLTQEEQELLDAFADIMPDALESKEAEAFVDKMLKTIAAPEKASPEMQKYLQDLKNYAAQKKSGGEEDGLWKTALALMGLS